MDGGHGSVVLAKHVGEQVRLEPVLHGGACQFEHVAFHRSQSDEEEHQCDQQDGVTSEDPYIARYGAVDEATQKERIPDDAHAQHRLHDRQENNMQFGVSGDVQHPAKDRDIEFRVVHWFLPSPRRKRFSARKTWGIFVRLVQPRCTMRYTQSSGRLARGAPVIQG